MVFSRLLEWRRQWRAANDVQESSAQAPSAGDENDSSSPVSDNQLVLAAIRDPELNNQLIRLENSRAEERRHWEKEKTSQRIRFLRAVVLYGSLALVCLIVVLYALKGLHMPGLGIIQAAVSVTVATLITRGATGMIRSLARRRSLPSDVTPPRGQVGDERAPADAQ